MSTVRALPVPDSTSDPYWQAAREGRLLIQRCTACGTFFSYARPFCPVCWSEQVTWVHASGAATLYTWSVVHVNDLPAFKDLVPYVAAIVDLAEGPRMASMIVDCPHDQLRIGMPLTVGFFAASDEISLPAFRPAALPWRGWRSSAAAARRQD